jgi:hypothetical protein
MNETAETLDDIGDEAASLANLSDRAESDFRVLRNDWLAGVHRHAA